MMLKFCQPIWPFSSSGQAIQCLRFPLQWPQALHSLPQVLALIWRKMCCYCMLLLLNCRTRMVRLSKLSLEASRRSSHASWKWELPFGSTDQGRVLSKSLILQPPSASFCYVVECSCKFERWYLYQIPFGSQSELTLCKSIRVV